MTVCGPKVSDPLNQTLHSHGHVSDAAAKVTDSLLLSHVVINLNDRLQDWGQTD
jgi:hypothetical protein